MKTNSICTTLSLILLPFWLLAQSQTDYLITASGKKLVGEFFITNDYFKGVDFREDGKNGFKKFSSAELKSAKIMGNSYETVEVKQDKNLLLRVFCKGRIDLYEGIQTNELNQFYIRKSDSIAVLEQNKKLEIFQKDEGLIAEYKKIIRIDNSYILPLKQAIIEQTDLVQSVDKMKFGEKTIIKLIDKYNARYPEDPDFGIIKTAKRLAFRHTITLKAYLSELNGELLSDQRFIENRRKLGISYLIGLKLSDRIVIETGLDFSSRSFVFQDDYGLGYREWVFEDKILSYPIQANYYFGTKLIRPYITIGASYQRILNLEYELRDVLTSGAEIPLGCTYARPYFFSTHAAFGLEYKEAFIQLGFFEPLDEELIFINKTASATQNQWIKFSLNLGYSF